VNLFAGGSCEVTFQDRPVRILQTTAYPREEGSTFTFELEEAAEFGMAIRIPGWCRTPSLNVNGVPMDLGSLTKDGYAYLRRAWTAADRIELALPMPVERVRAHPGVRADAGKVALQRGPIVYCLEEIDNGKNLWTLAIPDSAPMEARHDPILLGGTEVVEGPALRRSETAWRENLYSSAPPSDEPVRLRAVPYRLWGNRGPGGMTVWIREHP